MLGIAVQAPGVERPLEGAAVDVAEAHGSGASELGHGLGIGTVVVLAQHPGLQPGGEI